MKIKNLFNRIPRPVKAIFCAVCVVVLAIAYYIALGCPTTFPQEFRRAEKAHLVGPSKIVDRIPMPEYNEFQTMLVGETEQGILFFGKYGTSRSGGKYSGEWRYLFRYLEKTGNLTIAAAPNVWGTSWVFYGFEQSLPVYLFTEESQAVRAQVEITVSGEYKLNEVTTQYTQTFQAEADRLKDGVFRFRFTADDDAGLSALYFLSKATGGYGYDYLSDAELEAVFPATVRLYDAGGKLILERELEIRPQR